MNKEHTTHAEGGDTASPKRYYRVQPRKENSVQLNAKMIKKLRMLEAANAQLQRQVKHQFHEIKKRDRLLIEQQRLAKMGELMQMIAHQWRQPLNNMSFRVQKIMMLAKRGPLDEKFMESEREQLLDQIYHLDQTMTDFRNFFSPFKSTERFNLRQLVSDSLQFIGHDVNNADITLDLDALDAELEITSHRGELGQVFLVILNNAIDQFEHTGSEDRRIRIEANVERDHVQIRFCDYAGGIPSTVMPKLWEPYFTTKAKSGSGIGLYMTKMMVEKSLGGTIAAFNQEGGACFAITLPLDVSKDQ